MSSRCVTNKNVSLFTWENVQSSPNYVRRPEEVISKINQIFLYSSGKLPRRSLARRKYQIYKCEQRLYRNLQEVVSRFAHTQLCLTVKTTHLLVAEGEQKHLKYRGKSRPTCSGRDLATRSVSKGNAPFPPRIKVAHRSPQPARARSGRNVVPATDNRNTTTRASNFHHSGTFGSVDRKGSSELDRAHLSRTSAPCRSESRVVGGSADALTRLWRGRKPSRRRPARARGEPQGCTECRRFPLRAYTGVHHDRCRLEVAVA